MICGVAVSVDLLAVAQHDEDDRIAGAAGHQPLDVGEALDRLAVDADEPVAGQEAGRGRRAVRH